MSDRREVNVPDSYCVREVSSGRPATSLPCQGQCQGVEWQYGPWSACSQSCGQGGARTREAACYDQEAGRAVEPEMCELGGLQPALLTSQCEAAGCPGWQVGQWSVCSVTCGRGRQVREVSCQKDELRVEAGQCEGVERPASSQECRPGPECGVWRPGAWSVCSSDCGPGLRTRTNHCEDGAGQSLPPAHCSHHTRPVNTSTCVVLSCDHTDHRTAAVHRKTGGRPRQGGGRSRYSHHLPRYRWKIGRWSSCSSRCGGRKSRVVACYDRV